MPVPVGSMTDVLLLLYEKSNESNLASLFGLEKIRTLKCDDQSLVVQ